MVLFSFSVPPKTNKTKQKLNKQTEKQKQNEEEWKKNDQMKMAEMRRRKVAIYHGSRKISKAKRETT